VNQQDGVSGEAAQLITEAALQGVVLRAIGSVGVRLHCHASSSEMDDRKRFPKDIDLVTRKEDRLGMRRFFEDQGFEPDRNMLVAMEGSRYLFRSASKRLDVDVWVDVLDFCHRLDIRKRLGDGPTLPIEDLVLSKLQIHELTQSDRSDLAAMFATHEIAHGAADPEMIDARYIARMLASDWGFCRTATQNLDLLEAELGAVARQRMTSLRTAIDAAPKSVRWRVRAKVGDRVQWWQDVDIPRDTY